MSWRTNIVWSLRWDPEYHEEGQNGLENKIHIRKVISRGSEKFWNILVEDRNVSRRFLRGH
jgi:hypothetical protein